MTTAWEARLSRARHLAASSPPASGIVPFYAEVLGFQAEVYARLQRELPAGIPGARKLRDRLDPSHVIDDVPRLLAFVQAAGSPALQEASSALIGADDRDWMELLTVVSGRHSRDHPLGRPLRAVSERARTSGGSDTG